MPAVIRPKTSKIPTFKHSDLLKISAETSFEDFFQCLWPILEPGTDLKWNWHLAYMCRFMAHFAASYDPDRAPGVPDVEDRRPLKYVLNVPPGSGKSSVAGKAYCLWRWALTGGAERLVFVSYDQSLLNNQANQVIEVLQHPIWQAAFPDATLKVDRPAASEFWLKGGGCRFSTTPRAKLTGRHFTAAVIDDSLKADEALNEVATEAVVRWYTGTLPTRAKEPSRFPICNVMQRLSQRDLAEYMLQQSEEGTPTAHLCLPMRYQAHNPHDKGHPFPDCKDPRKADGDLLFPERWDEATVRGLEIALKSQASGQLQQSPVLQDDALFPETSLNHQVTWNGPQDSAAPMRMVTTWDFSAGGTADTNSRCVGVLIGATRDPGPTLAQLRGTVFQRKLGHAGPPVPCPLAQALTGPRGPEYYIILDWVAGHWTYPQQKQEFLKAVGRWSGWGAWKHLIEKKANGAPLIQDLGNQVRGIEAVIPLGSKEERARVHTDLVKAGQLVFNSRPLDFRMAQGPEAVTADDIRAEMAAFPAGQNDDFVDALTQGLAHFQGGPHRGLEALADIARRINDGSFQ